MDEQAKILCVDDEKNVLRSLQRLFLDDEYKVYTAQSAMEGLNILHEVGEVQVVVSDYRMPGMNGIEFFREVYKHWPDSIRIVLSGYADTTAVVEAINDGHIYKFIPKPWNDDELSFTIQEGIKHYFLKQNNSQLIEDLMRSNEELRKINETLESAAQKLWIGTNKSPVNQILLDLINMLPIGIIITNSEGNSLVYNHAAGKNFDTAGINIEGPEGNRTLSELLHGHVQKLLSAGWISGTLRSGDRTGWIKGKKFSLENSQGLVLAFDLKEEGDV